VAGIHFKETIEAMAKAVKRKRGDSGQFSTRRNFLLPSWYLTPTGHDIIVRNIGSK
jgi:hypothetical protein